MVRDRLGRFRGIHLDVSVKSERLAEAGLDDIVTTVTRDQTANPMRLGMEISALLHEAADTWTAIQDTPEHKEMGGRILKNLFYED